MAPGIRNCTRHRRKLLCHCKSSRLVALFVGVGEFFTLISLDSVHRQSAMHLGVDLSFQLLDANIDTELSISIAYNGLHEVIAICRFSSVSMVSNVKNPTLSRNLLGCLF